MLDVSECSQWDRKKKGQLISLSLEHRKTLRSEHAEADEHSGSGSAGNVFL